MLRIFEKIVDISGRIANYTLILLVFFVAIDVVVRYVFRFSTPLSFEIEWHLYSIVILLGMSYTLQNKGQVRVDILYERMKPRTQRIVNIAGIILFLIPFGIVGLVYTFPYALQSFAQNEGTPDPGGIPIWWIIKFFIPLGFLLLLMQTTVWLTRLIQNKPK